MHDVTVLCTEMLKMINYVALQPHFIEECCIFVTTLSIITYQYLLDKSLHSLYTSPTVRKAISSWSFNSYPINYKLHALMGFKIHFLLYLSINGSIALVDLGRFFSNLIHTQSVGLLGWEISPSQGRYLHREQHKHRLNAHRHPCLEWDSNPRSQRLSERRQFMP
jgi:hypothetical protein